MRPQASAEQASDASNACRKLSGGRFCARLRPVLLFFARKNTSSPPQTQCRHTPAARTLKAIAGFALDLIAAKPVKPCDGGVFGAFYLLSKAGQNAAESNRKQARKQAARVGANQNRPSACIFQASQSLRRGVRLMRWCSTWKFSACTSSSKVR